MIKTMHFLKNVNLFNLGPARVIVFSFVVVIFIGSFLLNLPSASNNGQSIGLINAIFTATSATCVTGLVIADTATQWSLFGQITILVLIQIGGLGLVTLATFFFDVLGRKVGLKGMLLAQESINHFSYEGILRIVRSVVTLTFIIEITGAILLSMRFVPRFGARGIYMGVFHAISAFCNAGFDILGDYKSLTEYNNDPVVLYTVAGLIIVGGLGFIVWKDLFEYRIKKGFLLHTKVVLVITALLIFFGAVFFFTFEYNNPATMGNLSLFEKVNSSFFHSVTTRTAGFNTLSTNDMMEISKVATIILMFIGAASGSTAGGIKVTTIGVLVIAIISQLKGSNETIIFKRRVPHYVVNKALAITGISFMLVIIVTAIMLAVENRPFINVLYEATSAFGTVGLSTGMTPELKGISKVLLIITMFIGRVGPVSFAIAMTLKSNRTNINEVYPEGKIVVG